jgi:uncharacterized protein (TIGR02145 family)
MANIHSNSLHIFLISVFFSFNISIYCQTTNTLRTTKEQVIKKTLKIKEKEQLTKNTDTSKELYKSVKIGNQIWMTENLNVSTFRNGDPILEARKREDWLSLSSITPLWGYYECAPENEIYGKLYNWTAVTDPRGLAPKGWHIPSDDEWSNLAEFLGGEKVTGKKLKSTNGWEDDGNGTNESGFSALPGGLLCGYFREKGEIGYFWSSTLGSEDTSFGKIKNVNHIYKIHFLRDAISVLSSSSISVVPSGFSVRCIKD